MLGWLTLGILGLTSLNVLALGLCRAAAQGDRLERAAMQASRDERERRVAVRRHPGAAA